MKTYLSLSFSIIAIFLLQGSCAELEQKTDTTVPEDFCVIDETVPESWLDCDGKMVTLKGNLTPPQQIMQHPMRDMPLLSAPGMEEAPVPKRTLQNYMNVDNRQIILLSDTMIECIGDMEVTGMLEKISLGGPAGTKNSYKGWSVRVHQYQCF